MSEPERPEPAASVLPFPAEPEQAELEAWAQALRALPSEAPPPAAWPDLERRLGLHPRRAWLAWGGWAVAASLAALWLVHDEPAPAAPDPWPALVAANQALERELRELTPQHAAAPWQALQHAAAEAELARLDEALSTAMAQGRRDQALELWRARRAWLEQTLEQRRAPRLALSL